MVKPVGPHLPVRRCSLWLDCNDLCLQFKYYLIQSFLIILILVFTFLQLLIKKATFRAWEFTLFHLGNKLQFSGMPQTYQQVELGCLVHQSNSIFHSTAPCSSLVHLHKCTPTPPFLLIIMAEGCYCPINDNIRHQLHDSDLRAALSLKTT